MAMKKLENLCHEVEVLQSWLEELDSEPIELDDEDLRDKISSSLWALTNTVEAMAKVVLRMRSELLARDT
ncbi:unnamed protein product [marine sediment metagenome]|uniref:Uncharacterized protein n=1 Tax=marine sediment metagenome TaxID=412755 RepID=X1N188_9ZZZZ